MRALPAALLAHAPPSALALSPKTSATFRYRTQGALNRWELTAQTAGAAVGAGAVLARTLAASSQGFSMLNGTIVESHVGGAVTFAIKTLLGVDPSPTDPVLVLFRDAALATGGYTMMSLTAATSLTVSSGSSLGTTNSVAFRLWLVGFNDAGTFRLGIVNAGLGTAFTGPLPTDALLSSTAEGGAGNADAIATFYTGVAVASKPFAILAYADYPAGLVAAGTWSASPTTLQLYHTGIPLPGDSIATAARLAQSTFGLTAINGSLVASVAANNLTIALKTNAGADPSPADPVIVPFRSATLASGAPSWLSITAALSCVIFNTNALGTVNNTAFRLWVVLVNNAGSPAIGLYNALTGTIIFPLNQGNLVNTSNSTGVSGTFYTQAGNFANVPFKVIGYVEYGAGLPSAGAWSAAPSKIQMHDPGMKLPGDRVQLVGNFSGTLATGAGTFALGVVPPISGGNEFMTQTITPTSAANLLKTTVQCQLGSAAGTTNSLIAALFRDAITNALAATSGVQGGSATGESMPLNLMWRELAGTIASTIYRLRAGLSTGTVNFNGTAGGQSFSTASSNSYIEVEEIMA